MVNKANEPVTAGRATEAISINNSYSGGITILIKNIKSSSIMPGSVTTPLSTPTTSGSNGTMELEKFTARLTCSGTVSWLIFADNVQVSKINADTLEQTACCKITVEKD